MCKRERAKESMHERSRQKTDRKNNRQTRACVREADRKRALRQKKQQRQTEKTTLRQKKQQRDKFLENVSECEG